MSRRPDTSASRIELPPLGPLSPSERREHVLAACRTLGFAHAGICVARSLDPEREDVLRDWLSDGRAGEMSYLTERVEAMLDPSSVLEGARFVICVADRYDGARDRVAADGRLRGRIARYARGRDYHDVLRRRLKVLAAGIQSGMPDEATRAVVDTAPLMEREHAVRAGLGAIGKNTLLIRQGEGSWLLLGEVLTTLELEPDLPEIVAGREDPIDPCGSCTRCIEACPTDAITPFSVDASRCLSYTTIEQRGRIDRSLHQATGDWLFGCDVCQEVCPHNQPTRRTKRLPVLEAYAPRRDGFDLLDVLNWTEEDRREAFVTSSMKRAKLEMMRRNAVICAGNALATREAPELLRRIQEIAGDTCESELLRGTACDVLEDLGQPFSV